MLLVAQKLLLFRRNLSSEHGLSAALLLARKLPVLKLLDAGLESITPLASLLCGLLMQCALCIDYERQEL